MATLEMPERLYYYTPDEVAETISGIKEKTYVELWNCLAKTPKENQAPMGGDGSNGTVELPEERYTEKAWFMPKYWPMLSEEAQKNIIDACAKEKAEEDAIFAEDDNL